MDIMAKKGNRKDVILGEFYFRHCKLMAEALPLSCLRNQFLSPSYSSLLLGYLFGHLGPSFHPKSSQVRLQFCNISGASYIVLSQMPNEKFPIGIPTQLLILIEALLRVNVLRPGQNVHIAEYQE